MNDVVTHGDLNEIKRWIERLERSIDERFANAEQQLGMLRSEMNAHQDQIQSIQERQNDINTTVLENASSLNEMSQNLETWKDKVEQLDIRTTTIVRDQTGYERRMHDANDQIETWKRETMDVRANLYRMKKLEDDIKSTTARQTTIELAIRHISSFVVIVKQRLDGVRLALDALGGDDTSE